MELPGDGHVHTTWSWDTGVPSSNATMAEQCRRAVRIGLPALAFTEHLDVTPWTIEPGDLPPKLRPLVSDGSLLPPPLDAEGYLEEIERCRAGFPELRILSGVEFGQPHLHEARARSLVDLDALDRINGSLHTIPVSDEPDAPRCEPYTLYRLWPADEVVHASLRATRTMIETGGPFDVVSHIEYAMRYWPEEREGPFDPSRFEEDVRETMRTIAGSGRPLELNVGGPVRPWIPRWWRDEGGRAITFGSDAHTSDRLAGNFPTAALMAEHLGFRPGRRPEEPWTR